MKNKIALLSLLLVVNFAFSQKMMTRSGVVKFEATMPGIEEIAATNTTASCIFDKNTGEFVTLALVKAFRFKVPLMEEHFNENYIESDQFPKSTFKGKVLNFDNSKLAQGKASNFDIEGDLTLHGVTKKIKTKVNITPIGDKLSITSNFSVKLFDYQIKVPNLVKGKIAESAKINLKFDLEEKK
jgi:hypothetical protein